MPLARLDNLLALDETIGRTLIARLAAIGFGGETIAAAEALAPRMLDAVRLPLVRWTLSRSPDPAAAMARLWSYGDQVGRAEVNELLGGEVTAALVAAGWLAAEGEKLRACLSLTPLEGLYVASDAPDAGEDAVMGPGMTTELLRRLMPEPCPARVLDVGCGAGTFALVAARRGAKRAVGVDLSERAVAFGQLNARLNGVEVEFRQGDMLAPVAGDSFDLIVCQPPYVVQPPGVERTTYLHGGPTGDELAWRAVGELGPALAAGGQGLVMFDAAQVPGTSAAARARASLGRAPIDLVLLSGQAPPSDLQAIAYASLVAPALGGAYAEAVQRYAAHFEERHLTTWSRLLVVLGRPSGPAPEGGRFTVALPTPNLAAVDHAALATYLAGIEAAGQPDATLLQARLRPHPDALLVEERPAGTPAGAPKYRLRFTRAGLVADQDLPEAGHALLQLIAESDTVADAVQAYGRLCEAPPEAVRAQVLSFVRHALGRGFLTAAGQ